MNSETLARVLGALVGAAALIMAFTYAPPWQAGKPASPATEPPKPQPAASPPVRGPVVREIPQ